MRSNDYFVRATLTQNLGLSEPNFGLKFWRETEMAGIAKSMIADVHVEALRWGAFLSGQTRIDESHIPDT
jgi:hypothetical protein